MCQLVGAQVTVDNIDAGELVRYPVVILKGTAKGNDVICGLDWKHMNRFPNVDGKYTALVELKQGPNMVILQSAESTIKIRLDYRPMTTPYKVRVVYLTASDEDTQYQSPDPKDTDYLAKIDTSLKLLQSFTAESMDRLGYGRKTFALELDDKGKVVVHVTKHTKTGAELRSMEDQALWHMFYQFLEPTYSYDVNKVCAIMAFTRYDVATQKAHGHTALGGGGLGLFGSGSMYTWPASLSDVPKVFGDATVIDPAKSFDDSGLRGTMWASAATTLGAVMHEMGHTFGLPHSNDPLSIMSRGFDHINRMFMQTEPPRKGQTEIYSIKPEDASRWDAFQAARLNVHQWFQADGNSGKKFETATPPTLTIVEGQLVVKAPYGIRVLGAEADGHPSAFYEYRGTPPTELKIKRSELQDKVGTVKVSYYVIDSQGNEVRLVEP